MTLLWPTRNLSNHDDIDNDDPDIDDVDDDVDDVDDDDDDEMRLTKKRTGRRIMVDQGGREGGMVVVQNFKFSSLTLNNLTLT